MQADLDHEIMSKWQAEWDCCRRGAWTKKVLPTVSLDQPSPCFALAQALSGHGVFAAYLYRFKRRETPKCRSGYIEEIPEHLFTQCTLYQLGRPATPVSAADQEWRIYLRDTVCELWRKEQSSNLCSQA